MSRRSKKGAVEVQFNWVFIMIAGAVILIFFINLSQKYMDRGETVLAADILTSLGSIVTSAGVQDDTAIQRPVKDIKLELRCNYDLCGEYGCNTEFDYNSKGVEAPAWLEIEVVFAPTYITGDHLLTWSQEFNAPYKVCNFLYLTSDGHRYVFVHDDSTAAFADQVYDEFKKSKFPYMNKTHIDSIGSIDYSGEAHIRYVLLYNPAGGLNENLIDEGIRKSKNFDVIIVDGNMNSGMIRFTRRDGGTSSYVPDSPVGEYPYFTSSMLFGAVYSGEIDSYRCNVQKAFLKLRLMDTVYYNRVRALRSHYSSIGNTDCANLMGAHVTDKMIGMNDSSKDFNAASAGTMVAFRNGIEHDNKVANNICAGVY